MTRKDSVKTSLPELPPEADPTQILKSGLAAAKGPVALACSFSVEDIVIIDLLQQLAPETRVFALDTGRLNEETYQVAESLRMRFDLKIDWHFPRFDAVEQLERTKGLYSFRENLDNRHECCAIRKVEPLRRALTGAAGWITGQRRSQSVTRGELPPLEIDEGNGGILKINPLAYWSQEQVWQYARSKALPTNKLHQQGYPSIGCAPCTRAIREGEDPRAGRWWWENPEHKECGLHQS